MAAGEIYQKIISESYQGGFDKSLIINPQCAFQRKFNFGTDWTKVQVGMFISFTNEFEPNSNDTISANSGIFAGDNFSYMGFVKDISGKKYIPMFDTETDNEFVGMRYNSLGQLRPGITPNRYSWRDTTSGNYGPSFISSRGTILDNRDDIPEMFYPLYTWQHFHLVNGFCWYIGLTIEDGGSYYEINIYKKSNANSSFLDARVSDVSLTNLQINMGSNVLHKQQITGKNSKLDAFYFYNSFLTVRPRLHAMAIKKLL